MVMKKTIPVLVILFAAMSWMCSDACAQDVQFTAEIDQNKIVLGESAQLTFTVTGNQDVTDIPVPQVDGLDIQYLGPATRVTIVNGQYSSSKSWIYLVLPLRTGRFTIPSVQITVDSQNYHTQPLEIEVTDAATAAPGIAPPQGGAELEDKIFLTLNIPKDKVYVNERLPVKVILFISGLSVSDVHVPKFDQPGLDVEKFRQPRQYEQVINGVRYHVVEFDANIYPTRTGAMTVGPVTLDCNMVIQLGGRGPMGGSAFDDDFFSAFFDRYEKRPLTVTSKTVPLTVLPLPEENKPADFTEAVGQFNMDVSVGPAEVNVGDPITVKINVGGEGNFKAVQPPAFTNFKDFKVYDPQIKDEGGYKKLDQVLIPESENVTEVPTVSFSYFDPTLGRYQTIAKGPFPIKVHPSKAESAPPVVNPSSPAQQPDQSAALPPALGQDIIFIKDTPGEFYLIGTRFYRGLPFYLGIALLTVLWAFLYGAYRRQHKITTDSVYARRLLAPKEARRGLEEAKRCQEQDSQKFYDALFRTLQKYLGHKLHLPAGGVNFETVRAKLQGRVDLKWLIELERAFNECDAVRYAPSASDSKTRAESYARVARIIDALERYKL